METMKITKFGHSCLLVEENGLRILIDPNVFSTLQNEAKNIGLILITHEHKDHLDINSLKIVLQNNPQAKILTNQDTGAVLAKEGIAFAILENGQSSVENGVLIEGFGQKHELVSSTLPPTGNTGYFIANRFFNPSDAFTRPNKPVEILALPVSGPWLKLPESIDYALELKPKICFPVHDGMLKSPGSSHAIPQKVFDQTDIKFMILEIVKEYEF